jgi:2-methylcitrate dehydratase PrpD
MDGHPSAVLVPPILALAGDGGPDAADPDANAGPAAALDPTAAEAVTAYAAGYEVACAVGEAVSPDHYERGWHPTATVGRFGAAAAAASLLGPDTDRTRHALGIAASTAAGLKANFGSATKPLHAGLAARDGVSAGLLAAGGIGAGADPIGGEGGFGAPYEKGLTDGLPVIPPTEERVAAMLDGTDLEQAR